MACELGVESWELPTVPRHPFHPSQGRLESIEIDSLALSGNLLGDPARRSTSIYLPPEYDSSESDFPLIVYLGAYTSSALKQVGWRAFQETIPQRLERLVGEDRMGPVVMAFPDSFTSLGGNQFVNSPVMGNWEDYLLSELIPALERRFRISSNPVLRGLMGFSSGGYGALLHALRHAESWGGIAAHSPDIGFALAFRSDLAALLTQLARHQDSIPGFLARVRKASKLEGSQLHSLMLLGLAASYDPVPDQPLGLRLPVDLETCELIAERWQNWLRFDPLNLIEEVVCQQNLKSLQGLFLDCGTYDQYHLQYGLRRFARRLTDLGIPYFHQEFPDSHSGVEYRLDESLPYLYRSLGDQAN